MLLELAVWEGPEPASDHEAAATYDALYERYFEDESWFEPENATPPNERIAEYVRVLLDRYADLSELDEADFANSPWAAGPIMDDARGPIACISMRGGEVGEEAWARAVATAKATGLICFDIDARTFAE